MTPVGSDDLGRLTRRTDVERVGFYACANLNAVVRVRPAEEGKFPRRARVACRCGMEHDKGISWRPLNEGERMNAEVAV